MSRKIYVMVDGQTLVRRTDRTYSHCIVCKHNREADIARAEAVAKCDAKDDNWAYYVREAGPHPQYNHDPETLARYRHIVAIGQKGYLEERRAELLQRLESIDYNKFFAYALAGRPDLAAKQVEAARREGKLDVRMIEVQT